MSDLVSDTAPKGRGTIALGWWQANINDGDGENRKARGIAAKLRRALPIEVLCEKSVHRLGRDLGLGPARAEQLVQLATLLANVDKNESDTLAKILGGDEPKLSTLRFQRLMRAEGDELTDHLRRAIDMAGNSCNVAALAADILHWDAARPRWCFHYFGAEAPATPIQETAQ
jgi:CRISPR system Cascade subunit CasB